MIEHLLRFVLPAAFALLPEEMTSREATAILLAIGLQETGFRARRQDVGGPARSFWKFEQSGVIDVLMHTDTKDPIANVLRTLRYSASDELLDAIADNDVLAACFARCKLWTLPTPLPQSNETPAAWRLYIDAWHPGTPRVETWTANYQTAWSMVSK